MDLKLKNNAILTDTSFTKLNYLIATGDCNVNLGNLIRESQSLYDRIEATLEVVSNGDTASDIFYAHVSRYYHLRCDANSNTSFKALWGSSVESYQSSISFSGKVNILIGQTAATPKIVVNDVTTNLSAKTNGTNTANLYILKGSATTKVWNIKVYQSNVLVRDLIPKISYEYGHFGEVSLYDNVNSKFYYSSSTGSFTRPTAGISTAYVEDCPNISGIDILRNCLNLTRVRLNLGNVSGPIGELMYYSTLNGFDDNYESQVKPRLVGTWTINSYHSNAQRDAAQLLFDGLTIISDPDYVVDTLLDNNLLAVQSIDPNKPNYNPAVAVILSDNNEGGLMDIPMISGGGRYLLTKEEAAATTSIPVAYFRARTTVTDANSVVSTDNTATYDFDSFEEFQYFTSITDLAAGTGSATTTTGQFGLCTNLERIILPTTITTIGDYSFQSCSSLQSVNILPTMLSIGQQAFYNCSNLSIEHLILGSPTARMTSFGVSAFQACSKIKNITIYSSFPTRALHQSGNGAGTLITYGNYTGLATTTSYNFKKIILHGYINNSDTSRTWMLFGGTYKVQEIRIRDYVNVGKGCLDYFTYQYSLSFIEIGGTININLHYNVTYTANHVLLFRYNGIACTPTQAAASSAKCTKVCVGSGLSRQEDEDILALYLADTDWSAYSAKLATWYDYNGTYKWYYITDNLTNCTNTNPDAWPHITRGESYQTTIEPDEGLTLSSVQVQMLDTDTTSPTYDTLVDITSSVYDSSTSEINIPSVTGNVVITAVAN